MLFASQKPPVLKSWLVLSGLHIETHSAVLGKQKCEVRPAHSYCPISPHRWLLSEQRGLGVMEKTQCPCDSVLMGLKFISVMVTVFPKISVISFLQLQCAMSSVLSVWLLARTDYGATDPTRLLFPCESSLLSLTQWPFRYIRKKCWYLFLGSCCLISNLSFTLQSDVCAGFIVLFHYSTLFLTYNTSMHFYGYPSYLSLSLPISVRAEWHIRVGEGPPCPPQVLRDGRRPPQCHTGILLFPHRLAVGSQTSWCHREGPEARTVRPEGR